MENSIIYFLKISSKNPANDDLYDLLELETTFNLCIDDVINLKNKPYCDKLVEDYNTYFFKIVGRMFISDDEHENNGGVLTLVMEPYFVK
jgi:hypothetical protein